MALPASVLVYPPGPRTRTRALTPAGTPDTDTFSTPARRLAAATRPGDNTVTGRTPTPAPPAIEAGAELVGTACEEAAGGACTALACPGTGAVIGSIAAASSTTPQRATTVLATPDPRTTRSTYPHTARQTPQTANSAGGKGCAARAAERGQPIVAAATPHPYSHDTDTDCPLIPSSTLCARVVTGPTGGHILNYRGGGSVYERLHEIRRVAGPSGSRRRGRRLRGWCRPAPTPPHAQTLPQALTALGASWMCQWRIP